MPSDFIRGIPVNAVFHEKTGIDERTVNILRVGYETSQLFQFPVQFVEILYGRRGTKPLENLLHSMCQSYIDLYGIRYLASEPSFPVIFRFHTFKPVIQLIVF